MTNTTDTALQTGLTTAEVTRRLAEYGLNDVAETQRHWARAFLARFWGPIPWMLEITLILQFALGKLVDASIIAGVLVINAAIGFAFERKAQRSLAALREQLQIHARVLRDGAWTLVESQGLVPGDVIRLRAGDVIPADVSLLNGAIAVDQSSLTGETTLIECAEGQTAFAGSVVRRGEATAIILATGKQTAYGKTAQLVQTAKPNDHGDAFVQRIVVALLGFTGVLVIGVLIDALLIDLSFADVLLFALALLIAAIPVSLPVTFTLASAVGARTLAEHNVLTARLGAIKEAAGMDVLCTDKTGTLTRNELAVVATRTFNGYSKSKLLRLAALAADEAAHDPIDTAVLTAAESAKPRYQKARRLEFIPFDPATKRTESIIHRRTKGKKRFRVIKGAPHVISELTHEDADYTDTVAAWAEAGYRCIAIAAGKQGKPLKTVGLLALRDEPRKDAADVVEHLHELGVRVIMVTGDDLPTARNIAQQVGITGDACTADVITEDVAVAASDYDVFARVYPEDKYKLVETLQAAGHIVGMTGDGINDAPAIRQAEIGIAMRNATDITKSAASLILTAPGLKDMIGAIHVGRSIFQRMMTYTLNKIIKTFHIGVFLSFGLLLTGRLLVSPLHILLMVLANDIVSMSLTTDHVRPSPKPNQWRSMPLIVCGFIIALGWIAFSVGVYVVGHDGLMLDESHLDTLLFLMLVFVAIANVYMIRERRLFWRSRPSTWLLVAGVIDVILVIVLATQGILMAALDVEVILALLAATIGFMVLLDVGKVQLFRYAGLRQTGSLQPLPAS